MTDRIVLKGVRARGFHGVLDHEKRDGQDFVVDTAVEVDLTQAGHSDQLGDTVSYAEVADDVVAQVTGESLDLIETLAERIADTVLARPRVEAVEVVVHKPQAPVGHPFGDVQVQVRRERSVPVVLALGANLADPRRTLESAIRAIARIPGLNLDVVSPLVESDPVGGPEQPVYLNAVVLARTRLTPVSLLRRLHAIEAAHGRQREIRWAARTLDVDLVQYGSAEQDLDVRSDSSEVTLPHPRAHERGFVLKPWHLADPTAYLRVGDRVVTVADLLDEVDTTGVRPGPDWSPTW